MFSGTNDHFNPSYFAQRRLIIKIFFYLALLLVPTLVLAQQNYSLKDCITYGLKNNRSNIQYANDLKIADAKGKEALADYLPSISLNGSLDDNLKVQESVIPAGIVGPNSIKVAFTERYNTNVTAEMDQTLYDQSLLTGLKANKYNKQQARLNQQQNDESIIYNVSNAYYQIYVYREQLLLLKADLETYQKQLEISRLQVNKGTVLQTNMDKISVNYNNTRSQISVAESNLALSENQLKTEMGYPLDIPLSVDSSSNETVNPISVVKDSLTVFQVSNRSDYQLSQVNSKLLEIDEKRIAANALPKLTAYARYGGVGFGADLSPALSTLDPFSTIGIKLNIPLFDFFRRNAQHSQAKYKYLNALEDTKLDEAEFRMEFENARTKLNKATSNLENDQRNIVLAQSVFKITDLQYQKGVTGLTDWLNDRYSLKEAQNNYLVSLYNYYLARIDLEKANGTLKNFYNNL
ncbi:TolC family protein [Mucilaginibacter sp. L196]|uniref:TolC family protein n=1 Tax=Mucilaginibacter sp. L196 TaxID=1641870 RepID=UPI00131DBCFB|nr:TolC family protein [Mucilaginibacter sp. L196]